MRIRRYIRALSICILLGTCATLIASERFQASVHQTMSLLSDEPQSLKGSSLRSMVGTYILQEIKIEDTDERITFSFNTFFPKVYMVRNYGEGPRFLKDGLQIDKDNSTITITDQNVCHFKWSIRPKNNYFDPGEASVSGISLQGSQRVFGCLKEHAKAILPKELSNLKDISYEHFGSYLRIVTRDENLEQSFLYLQVKES